MRPYIYSPFKKKFYWLFSLMCVFALTSCGGYQNTGYTSDGIYGQQNRGYRTENPQEVNPQQSEHSTKSRNGYYKNYFEEQHDKIVEAQNYMAEDSVFTDIESYTTTAQNENEPQATTNIERQDYRGNQPAWGSNPTSVSVNFYNTGGFYGNPYYYNNFYGSGWGSPFHGYGYGYGYRGYPYYNNWAIGFSPWYGYYSPYSYWGAGGYYGGYYNPYYYQPTYYNRYRNVAYHNNSRNYRSSNNYRSNKNYSTNSKNRGRSSDNYSRSRNTSVKNPNNVNARSKSSYKRSSAEYNTARRSTRNSSSQRRSSNSRTTTQPTNRTSRSTQTTRRSTPTRSSGSYGRSSSSSSSRSSNSSGGGGTRSSGRRR